MTLTPAAERSAVELSIPVLMTWVTRKIGIGHLSDSGDPKSAEQVLGIDYSIDFDS